MRNKCGILYGMFSRIIHDDIQKAFFQGKVILLIGARQTGKTTLIDSILRSLDPHKKVQRFNADEPSDADLFARKDFSYYDKLFHDTDIIFLDEAQRIPDIGLTLKILVDNYRDAKQLIVTGSSTFNLLDGTAEPLTGRKYTFELYPLGLQELLPQLHPHELSKQLEPLMTYGSYPDVVQQPTNEQKKRVLTELASSYLYKDILELQDLRNPTVLRSLLQMLALQIGSEVSYHELATKLGIDGKTVERYIDLLEKSYIVYRLPAFSQNPRKEINRNKKILFYDLGIRNMVIDTFTPFHIRADVGRLWENFVINERRKYLRYHNYPVQQYFWRSIDGAEIDIIEERGGKIYPFEIKWNPKKAERVHLAPTFQKQYAAIHDPLVLLTPENLHEFV